MKKRMISLLLIMAMTFAMMSGLAVSVSAVETVNLVSRDDGVWLWPLTENHYYNSCSDWAGCNSSGQSGVCPFHGYHCYDCGAAHMRADGHGHNGMDVGAVLNTAVYAMADGTVYCVNTNHASRGYTVVMEHPIGTDSNGETWSYYSFYQHLNGVDTSLNGKEVKAGTVIAHTGKSDGTASGGQPHLHFGILLGSSGQGAQMATNPNNGSTGLSYLESFGWIYQSGFHKGRILVNPADNIPLINGSSDSLRTHPGSVRYTFSASNVSIPKGEEYLAKCTFYHSYRTVKATKAGIIKTLPCSGATNADSKNIRYATVGEEFTVTGMYLNTAGNYWYHITANDLNGYIYAGDVESVRTLWDATISGISAPSTLQVGDRFSIKGKVSANHTELTMVYAGITAGEKEWFSKSDSASGSYELLNSPIDAELRFNELPEGMYTYWVSAYCNNYYSTNGTGRNRNYRTVDVHSSSFTVGTPANTQPGKPVMTGMRSSYEPGETVQFNWKATENTTHYNLYIERKNDDGSYSGSEHEFYAQSGITRQFTSGEYRALVQATNSNAWTDDGSTWKYTNSAYAYFTVGHKLDRTARKNPTCTETGNIEFWKCTVCGKYFKNAQSTMEITFEDTILPALGHNYVNGVCTRCGEMDPDAVVSGVCGDSLTWKLNKTTKVLTISGVGDMYDYDATWNQPWSNPYYQCAIQSIIIEAGVTSIGEWAFFDCYNLESVVLPKGIAQIGDLAFCGCESLKSVNIPDGVETIGVSAFADCPALISVNIPNSVTTIGDRAFCNATALTEIYIPESVATIGSFVFSGCTNLRSIMISESSSAYSSIDGVLFNKSESTLICYPAGKEGERYEIPDYTRYIQSHAFTSNCYVKEIYIPYGVEWIGYETFLGCQNLKWVGIPGSVDVIYSDAFSGCAGLTDVQYTGSNANRQALIINEGNEPLQSANWKFVIEVGDVADEASDAWRLNLETCTLAVSGNGAMLDYKLFDSEDYPTPKWKLYHKAFNCLIIEEGITYVGRCAFRGCDILTVQFPRSLRSIGTFAFGSTGTIKDVYYNGTEKEWNAIGGVSSYGWENATFHFTDCTHTALLYVAAISATCTKSGNLEYWYCDDCGKYFSDASATVETTLDARMIVPLGHNYINGACTRCGAADPDYETPDENTATFCIGNVKGLAGEMVTVPVSVENNPGVISVVLDISYDPAKLKLISAENTGLLKGSFVTSPDGSMPYALAWTDGTGANNTSNGIIANLTFEILQACEDGTVPITASYDPDNVFDEDWNNISFAVSNGAVEVISVRPGDVNSDGTVNAKDVALLQRYVAHWNVVLEKAAADVNGDGSTNAKDVALLQRYVAHWDVVLQSLPVNPASFRAHSERVTSTAANEPQEASISLANVEGSIGETVVIPVTIANNPGVISVVLDIAYDAQKVKLVGAESTGLLRGSFTKSPDGSIPYALTWIDGTGEDNTSNGVIANLTFEILEGCGSEGADITISYDPDNIFNSNWDNVAFSLQNGRISVRAEEHTHEMVHMEAVAATCTEDGSLEYWFCTECSKYYLDADGSQETTLADVTVVKLGHDYTAIVTAPTCTERGYTTHTCSRCGDSYVDAYTDAVGHAWGEWITTKEASCTETGEETRVCAHCGEKERRDIAALGHDYQSVVTAPTCIEQGYTTHTCSRCNDRYVDTYVGALGHDWGEWVVTKVATEYSDGEKTRTCARCGEVEMETIPALGHIHQLTHVEAAAATCTEEGNVEYWYCTGCGKYFSDEAAADEITEAETVLSATGHKTEVKNTKTPDCTENGYTGDTVCSVCGEMVAPGEVIPALGHDWGEWVVTKEAAEESDGEEARTCARCGGTETRTIPALGHTHDMTHVEAVEPTCTEDGSKEYWYCAKCGNYYLDAEGTQETTMEALVLEALGHDYHVTKAAKAATCTEAGNTEEQTCARCGEKTGGEVIPALGHDYQMTKETKEATCTEAGNMEEQTCARCGEKTGGEVIPALGHDYHVTKAAKAATCTEAGNTEEQTCARCGGKMGGEVVPALGHDWGDWVVVKEPSDTEAGEKVCACSRCDAEEKDEIPPLSHMHQLIQKAAKEATCTEAGSKEYWYCETCGSYFSDAQASHEIMETDIVVPALGHTPVLVGMIQPTPFTKGYSGDLVCGRCGEMLEKGHVLPAASIVVKSGVPVVPVVTPALPFVDVHKSDWYYDSVKDAWENGLIDGVTATEFRPEETLTVAQAIKLAAALHQLDRTGSVTLTNGTGDWYSTYVDYAVANGVIEASYKDCTRAQMNAPITRAEFVHIFHGAMRGYTAINTVADGAIPDVKTTDQYGEAIYTFYRAGILNGSDAKGTFHPTASIKRSEVAAILIRMYDASARLTVPF